MDKICDKCADKHPISTNSTATQIPTLYFTVGLGGTVEQHDTNWLWTDATTANCVTLSYCDCECHKGE